MILDYGIVILIIFILIRNYLYNKICIISIKGCSLVGRVFCLYVCWCFLGECIM